MNWDQIEGNWKQFKGAAKQQWGKLTDDQLDVIAGKHDQLIGRIQESYGITREATEAQVKSWLEKQKPSIQEKAAMKSAK
ncbi:MAG TPA: CsbD family protein [Usitatibacteraceae bacterium]|nr:CsbD family protein [Usitatibacteraceae bacterium]